MEEHLPQKVYTDGFTLTITNIIEPPEEHPAGVTIISVKKKSHDILFSWTRKYGLISKNEKNDGSTFDQQQCEKSSLTTRSGRGRPQFYFPREFPFVF